MAGNGTDIHTAMIATQKADLAFEMALAFRNKAVGAYQQLHEYTILIWLKPDFRRNRMEHTRHGQLPQFGPVARASCTRDALLAARDGDAQTHANDVVRGHSG